MNIKGKIKLLIDTLSCIVCFSTMVDEDYYNFQVRFINNSEHCVWIMPGSDITQDGYYHYWDGSRWHPMKLGEPLVVLPHHRITVGWDGDFAYQDNVTQNSSTIDLINTDTLTGNVDRWSIHYKLESNPDTPCSNPNFTEDGFWGQTSRISASCAQGIMNTKPNTSTYAYWGVEVLPYPGITQPLFDFTTRADYLKFGWKPNRNSKERTYVYINSKNQTANI